MVDTTPGAFARVQRDLVRSAVNSAGARSIAERLAAALGGWLLLIDADGSPRAAVPESARAYLARVLAEMPDRGPGGPTAVAISLPVESVSIRSVIVSGKVRGHLAVGRATALTPDENLLVETATHLLAEDVRRTDALHRVARSSRLAVLNLLLAGHDQLATSTAEALGVTVPDGDVRAAMLVTLPEHAADLLEAAESDRALRRIDTLCAELSPGRVAVVLPTAEGDLRTLEAVLRRVPHCRGSASEVVPLAELPGAWGRVQDVFHASSGRTRHLVVARDVVEAGLLRHLTGDDVVAWSQSAIAPIVALGEGSRVDFAKTLVAYLSNNGQADASAKQLGIHRHTLRYRINRIEETIRRELDDPTVRAELWLAFQMTGHY
ncbi:hypothetical protein nbrc107696_41100 [Gordonia spumicola]|uniref:PucR C-terminal helix-turn-helix domain-containing protein n=1 Tax=Gordonia spumicola TaxID=589161 RepID=A0A7I9VED0_9ACTN|nr:helix-turn-helix domain-containing protein [Gordonia spumicola]GEE03664.1 hypothetical protein nbrc107696_41100 [Gordonia spumicola]